MPRNGPESSKIFLGFGSNLGHPRLNILRAVDALGNRAINITVLSSFYLTEPVGYADQPWFINAVAEVETALTPRGLLENCLLVEQEMKRERGLPSGPRIIDIDILFFGQYILETEALILPHPRLVDRKFVLVPLAEISPDFMHPGARRTVKELLESLRSDSQVRKFPF